MRALAVAISLIAFASTAAAQDPALVRNDYSIDLASGPVLGSGRAVSLGGAYVALAEGIDSSPWNPAAYGARSFYERDWFEWDVTFSLLLPGVFTDNDFFNTNRGERASAYFVGFGGRIQLGDTGFGGLVRGLVFELDDDAGNAYDLTLAIGNYGAARELFDGQLVVGIGARTASLDILDPSGAGLVSFSGTGFEGGVLYRPADAQFRFGFAARTTVESTGVAGGGVQQDPSGVRSVVGYVLPRSVHMPWELEAGVAIQLGRRPLNVAFVHHEHREREVRDAINVARNDRERRQVEREMAADGMVADEDPYVWLPRRARDPDFTRRERVLSGQEELLVSRARARSERDRQRYIENLSRSYLLITAETLIIGPTTSGVGIEGFLTQERHVSGKEMSVGARLGIETEPIPGWFRLRLGSYLEPTRFESSSYRMHGTGGFDLRLFETSVFGLFDPFQVRVSATMDVAPRWFDWGVGIGVWH